MLKTFAALALLCLFQSCSEQTSNPITATPPIEESYLISWDTLSIHEKTFYCLYQGLETFPEGMELTHDFAYIIYPSKRKDQDGINEFRLVLGCNKSKQITTATGTAEIEKLLKEIPEAKTLKTYDTCTVPLCWGIEDSELAPIYALFPRDKNQHSGPREEQLDDQELDDFLICTCSFKNVTLPK